MYIFLGVGDTRIIKQIKTYVLLKTYSKQYLF